jgi:ketosteroid isomerase-like protein
MRKFLCLALMLCIALPAIARDDENKIKAVPQDRYKEWLTAENKKDAELLITFYDDNAVLMPSKEEPVIGKAAIGECPITAA